MARTHQPRRRSRSSSPTRIDRPRAASIRSAAAGTASGHQARGSKAAARPSPATSPASTEPPREFSRRGDPRTGPRLAAARARTAGWHQRRRRGRGRRIVGAVGAASASGAVAIRLPTLLAAPRAHRTSYADPRPSGTVHRASAATGAGSRPDSVRPADSGKAGRPSDRSRARRLRARHRCLLGTRPPGCRTPDRQERRPSLT